MSDTRKLTVGVTINLGNSECLHLEVSDDAESEYDAAELRTFLASVLEGYGTNDSAVRTAIASYCRRVLADAKPVDADSFEESTVGLQGESETDISMDMFSSQQLPETDADLSFASDNQEKNTLDVEEDKRMEIDEDDYLRLPPAPLVEESAEEFVCSKCGATVSKLQRDVSMLFNHKILCKDCMR